jgi:predicted RNA-binding protein Jag
MLYTSSNHTILLNGQFISVHAAQTILAKSGRNLSLAQIRSRNVARTLHNADLDVPTNKLRVAVNKATQARKRQEMLELMAQMDAAKAKLNQQN